MMKIMMVGLLLMEDLKVDSLISHLQVLSSPVTYMFNVWP